MGCGASVPLDAKARVSDEHAPPMGARPEVVPVASGRAGVPPSSHRSSKASNPSGSSAVGPSPGLPLITDKKASPAPTEKRAEVAASSVLPSYVSADELGQLCQATNFDRKQVERLYETFKVISSSGANDGLIDRPKFESALGLRSSLFVDRIFQVFDQNADGHIAFEEFVLGLSTFSARASRGEKCQMSFRIYDIDGDGFISRDELGRMLRATIAENGLTISESQFEELIVTTFEQAGAAGKPGLSLDEFVALVKQRPAILGNMTIGSLSLSSVG